MNQLIFNSAGKVTKRTENTRVPLFSKYGCVSEHGAEPLWNLCRKRNARDRWGSFVNPLFCRNFAVEKFEIGDMSVEKEIFIVKTWFVHWVTIYPANTDC